MTEFSSLQSSAVIFPSVNFLLKPTFQPILYVEKKTYVTDPEVGLQIQH